MSLHPGNILAMVALMPAHPFSQDSTSAARLAVTSNLPEAVVFVDSVRAGLAPLRNFALMPGLHIVCVAAPDPQRWIVPSRCESVVALAGDTIELSFDLHYQFRITSEPYGARVMAGDSVLGQTPFVFSTQRPQSVVTLLKDGYENLTVVLTYSDPYVYGMLKPLQQARDLPVYLVREESNSILPIVLSASSAVVSGAAAAYLKIQADNLYSDYRMTGSAANLERVRQLDIASGVALGISQLSLAVLSYLLLSR